MVQILSYITWVKNNLATEGQKVRGLIVVRNANAALLSAQEAVKDMVGIKYYKVRMELVEPE